MRSLTLLFAAVGLAALSGCGPEPKRISNQEIIEKTKECRDAGMGVRLITYWNEKIIWDVQCDPSKNK